MTFDTFKSKIEELIKEMYLINLNDCTDDDGVKAAFDNKETVQEFVDWVGEKYELTPYGEMK